MSEWNYGNSYLRHPIEDNQIAVLDGGSKLKVHNIFDPLPEFMKEADLIFVDPPWNLGNLNTFYTKADRNDYQDDFGTFYHRFFECVKDIGPKVCYVEVGKEFLAAFIIELKKMYRQVTFYNSTYYHKRENLCYVIRASNTRKKLPLDGMDEEEIIEWVCANEDYNCIGDLCMGLGLVGLYAHRAGKRFVGTELNHKRLSVLLEKLAKLGCTYKLEGAS